jgi:SAM-dependent methyltransferase
MEATGPNAEQIEYWNTQSGQKWVAQNARLDQLLEHFGLAALERAKPAKGERVLDVGCGLGATTRALAARVGPSGSVTGVDISTPMLAAARERARVEKCDNVRFENADAQTHTFTPNSFDLLFSRFGVMFFIDPLAAFINLARAVRPGGRLSFVCWQGLGSNAWMREPMAAMAKQVTLPAPATPPDPNAPGPMAFADAARVRGILERAGFRNVNFEPYTGQLLLGRDVDDALVLVSEIGPASRLLAEVTPAQRDAALGAVRELLAANRTSKGVELGFATWLVTGER